MTLERIKGWYNRTLNEIYTFNEVEYLTTWVLLINSPMWIWNWGQFLWNFEAKFLERSIYGDKPAWPLKHGFFFMNTLWKGCVWVLCKRRSSRLRVTLVESESYSLCRSSSWKTRLFIPNCIETFNVTSETIFKNSSGIVGTLVGNQHEVVSLNIKSYINTKFIFSARI